jgi:FeS assembly SUF system regulator
VIKVSRVTDYGIVLLAHLAGREEGSTHNARELAERTGLPAPMVSRVLKALARKGLLVSHRGSKGGYRLTRSPDQIAVREIIAALEGPIALTECAVHPGACRQERNCDLREPWQRINQRVSNALADITLADLAPSETRGPIAPLRSLGVDSSELAEARNRARVDPPGRRPSSLERT